MPTPRPNSHPRIVLSLLCAGATILTGCATDAPAPRELPDSETVRAFLQTQSSGYAALEVGSLEVALARFDELLALIPDSPLGHYHRACALGRTSETSEAAAALRTAIAHGFSDLARAENDPDLAAVRGEESWGGLVAAMHAALTDQRAQLHASLSELPNDGEPSFPDLDSLRSHYNPLYYEAAMLMRVYPEPLAAAEACRVLSHKLAGLGRYRAEHENEPERYATDLELLTSLRDLPDMEGRPWVVGRSFCERYADRILQTYPDSSGAVLAALWKVRSDWYGRQQAPVAEVPPAELAPVVERLAAVAERYPGTPSGAEALAEAIVLQAHATERDLAAIRPLVAALRSSPAYQRQNLGRFAYDVSEYILLAAGPADFTASDIDGRRWDLAALRGSVCLLDFWATWCGPCHTEIPTLVQLQARYADDGLRILGISLDSRDRLPLEEFRAWLAEREMTWPQIYTGDGWQTQVAERYKVPAIPFPVLIDRQGTVIAAGVGARGDRLKERLAEIFGH